MSLDQLKKGHEELLKVKKEFHNQLVGLEEKYPEANISFMVSILSQSPEGYGIHLSMNANDPEIALFIENAIERVSQEKPGLKELLDNSTTRRFLASMAGKGRAEEGSEKPATDE